MKSLNQLLLVGNPNTGKTTLFNSLTGANEHVGNWHGVTVENKQKNFSFKGEEFALIDTPGIYSLTPLSFEEKVAVKTILENKDKKIINICDQNNIQRNLYLTLCLLEEGCDVILAINEIDKRPIFKVDCKKLSKRLGVDVITINAEKKIGLEDLKKSLSGQRQNSNLPYLKSFKNKNFEETSRLRYQFIDEIIKDCTTRSDSVYGKSKIDRLILNKWLAFPIFALILVAVFYLTFFSLGACLSDLLSALLNIISKPILNLISNAFGTGWIYDLFNVAFFGGVATVLSFLPQVVLLFFFLSILEDSGYLSRVAFIFEDILGKIGLSGKSVYTLLMGFGCSTTAIMTARNMDDKNAKIKTAILCPYMSCSAKIPIYTVIGGAFFGAKNIFVILGLYVLGVVIALLISKIFDMTILKSTKQSFILEFPPYRATSLKRVAKILWKNLKDFLIRVGTIMVCMNIVIWILSSFNFKFQYTSSGSMLESFGKLLAPIFIPLGFGNWAIVSALLAGLVAKEVVLSSIAMFNGIDSSATKLLSNSIMLSSSVVFFSTKASVLSFLVFCLLYTPCISSMAMMFQEIGKKWTVFAIIIQLVSAYAISFVVFNLAFAVEIFGGIAVLLIFLAFSILIFAPIFLCWQIRRKKLCAKCENCDAPCKR